MKKIILICGICFSGYATHAQVTIGSLEAPEKGALLDLKQNTPATGNITATKGMLLPRVNLTKADKLYPMFEATPGSGTDNADYAADPAGLETLHAGLTVYNLNNCFPLESSVKSGAGPYVWTGTEWQPLGESNVVQTLPVSGTQPQVVPSSLPTGAHISGRTVYVPYRYADRGNVHKLVFTAPDLGAGTKYEWSVDGVYRQGSTSATFEYDLPLATGRHTVSLNVRDCCTDPPLEPLTFVVGCGAFVAPGVWREFMCYNLGADESVDPFEADKKLFGDYYQWGRSTVAAFGPNYTANPDGLNGTWDRNSALDGAWADDVKTENDPCPEGFRVPTRTEWLGVFDYNLNPQTSVGNYVGENNPAGPTTFGCGVKLGDCLYLPATGYRIYTTGELRRRGNQGEYWATTHLEDHFHAYEIRFNGDKAGDNSYLITTGDEAPSDGTNRTRGYQVRCIAE